MKIRKKLIGKKKIMISNHFRMIFIKVYKTFQNYYIHLTLHFGIIRYQKKKIISCRDNYRQNFHLFPFLSDLHS